MSGCEEKKMAFILILAIFLVFEESSLAQETDQTSPTLVSDEGITSMTDLTSDMPITSDNGGKTTINDATTFLSDPNTTSSATSEFRTIGTTVSEHLTTLPEETTTPFVRSTLAPTTGQDTSTTEGSLQSTLTLQETSFITSRDHTSTISSSFQTTTLAQTTGGDASTVAMGTTQSSTMTSEVGRTGETSSKESTTPDSFERTTTIDLSTTNVSMTTSDNDTISTKESATNTAYATSENLTTKQVTSTPTLETTESLTFGITSKGDTTTIYSTVQTTVSPETQSSTDDDTPTITVTDNITTEVTMTTGGNDTSTISTIGTATHTVDVSTDILTTNGVSNTPTFETSFTFATTSARDKNTFTPMTDLFTTSGGTLPDENAPLTDVTSGQTKQMTTEVDTSGPTWQSTQATATSEGKTLNVTSQMTSEDTEGTTHLALTTQTVPSTIITSTKDPISTEVITITEIMTGIYDMTTEEKIVTKTETSSSPDSVSTRILSTSSAVTGTTITGSLPTECAVRVGLIVGCSVLGGCVLAVVVSLIVYFVSRRTRSYNIRKYSPEEFNLYYIDDSDANPQRFSSNLDNGGYLDHESPTGFDQENESSFTAVAIPNCYEETPQNGEAGPSGKN